MATPTPEFGPLLSQGLKSIAARERRGILALEDQLGDELGVTRSAIEKWRRGATPADPKVIAYLARAGVRRGGMDAHWLNRFLALGRIPDSAAFMQELFPDGSEGAKVPAVRHNLPRRPFERFIGREQALSEMQRYLSPDHRIGVICLSGVAGIGKTALALEVAHRMCEQVSQILPDERFETIVWVTAKQAELLPAGLASRHPTFTDLKGVYQALTELLSLASHPRARRREAQEVVVARALATRRILLVLDNLEDVDDSALMVFLRDLPAPSKAIVTTRHRIDVAAPIHIRAFQEVEARELIRAECQAHTLIMTEEREEKLLRRTGGLPLAIVRTIGRMAWRGSSVEAELRQLGDPQSDIYTFCFERSIALIRGRDAHRLFIALAIFTTSARRDALGEVAGFGGDLLSRDEGLSDLEVLSLITKEDDRFSLEPLTRIKARAELTAADESERDMRERWIAWYKARADEAHIYARYPQLSPELDNVLGLLEWLNQQDRMADLGWLLCRYQAFLFAKGAWTPMLYYAERVVPWAEAVGDTTMVATILQYPINVLREQGLYAQAASWLERMHNAAMQSTNEYLQAEAWYTHGRLLYDQGLFVESLSSLTHALELFRKRNVAEQIVWALNMFGNVYLAYGKLEDAARLYQEGLATLASYDSSLPDRVSLELTLKGNLGIIAGRQGQYLMACTILSEILDGLTEQTDLAEVHAILAFYTWQVGRKAEALQHRRQADEIIARLQLTRPICEEDDRWMERQA